MREDEIATALARIEQRQAAYEVVAHRLLGVLEVHNEKLDAILEAATVEPGPSPTTEALERILLTMQDQVTLLRSLPEAITDTIRDEMQRLATEDQVEWESAEDAFGEEGRDSVEGRGAEDKP